MTTYKNQLELDILQEDADQVTTYSLNYSLLLCSRGRNFGPYQNFEKQSQLTVPYSIIKFFKEARELKIRELYLISAERPDTHPSIRSSLNLWGFQSLIEYIYTVAELGFLEGLVPVLDLGLLLPPELNRLKEITSVLCIHLVNQSGLNLKKDNPELYEKKQQLYLDMLNWTGKLDMPTRVTLNHSSHLTSSDYEQLVEKIQKEHGLYNHVHEISLIPDLNNPETDKFIEFFKTIQEACPNITVNTQYASDEILKKLIELDIKDLGSIHQNIHPCFPSQKRTNISEIEGLCEAKNRTLQQRFSIKKSFIENTRYSEKLGQIFDAYRYKIKKSHQEKKEEKMT